MTPLPRQLWLLHAVWVDRPGSLDEDDIRAWCRANVAGRWNVPAWRVYVETVFSDSGKVRFDPTNRRTQGRVEFSDETDATLFAVWAGGKIVD